MSEHAVSVQEMQMRTTVWIRNFSTYFGNGKGNGPGSYRMLCAKMESDAFSMLLLWMPLKWNQPMYHENCFFTVCSQRFRCRVLLERYTEFVFHFQ